MQRSVIGPENPEETGWESQKPIPLMPYRRQVAISPTLRVNERAKALIAQGHPVIHMGFGESQFPPPDGLVRALAENAGRVEYEKVQGIDDLRQKIAATYNNEPGDHVHPSQVIVAPGSKALLYACINQLRGDVLLPRPSWVSYQPQALYSGKQVFWIDTRFENNYLPTSGDILKTVELARQAGGDPCILILNSPNNPTGAAFSVEQTRDIAELCRELGLTVLSDELYRRIMHPGKMFHSIAQDYPEGTILIGGLSKDVAVGGWRLGWAIVPDSQAGRELIRAVNGLGSEIWSSAPSPVQHAAVYALSNPPEIQDYVTTMGELHGFRTRLLYESLTQMGIRAPEPSGGFYLYLDFSPFRAGLTKQGVGTSEALEAYLLEHLHVAALAGSAFGDVPESLCLRFSTSHLDCPSTERTRALMTEFSVSPDRQAFITPENHPQLFEVIRRFERLTSELRN